MAEGIGGNTARAGARTVFISYASQDATVANAVVGALEHAGLSCWIAPRDVEPGARYADEIVSAINDSRVVVLLLSAHSVASAHVGKELERASSKNRRIIALRTDASPLPHAFEYFLSESQWIEVGTGGIEAAAARLAESLHRHLGSAPTADQDIGDVEHASPKVSSKRARNTLLSIAAVLAVVIASATAWKLWLANPSTATQRSATAITDRSIAVLPFVDMSPERDQEYFSDGLAEELLNQLAQIKELRLTARTSSFSFKGKNEDVRTIGEKLGVGNVLEGSVRKSGNRLRITAQLINATDGTHRWSKTYDRDMTDVFAVQEEIAMAVSEALSVSLDVGAMSRARGGTTNLEAYDKFLRAQAVRRQQGGPNDVLQATQLFRETVALDPKFVQGWSGLYSGLTEQLIYVPENAAAARKEMTEVRALLLTLAPDDWRAQALRVDQLMEQRKWAEAEIAGSAAVASAPASGGIGGNFYTIFLLNTGRIQEALPRVERNSQADPLSLNASYAQQITLFLAGRPAEAEVEYERSKALGGDHANVDNFALLRMMARKNADPAAVKALYRLSQQHGGLTLLGRLSVDQLQNTEAALSLVRQAFKDPTQQTATGMLTVSRMADYFGDKDLTLAALRRSYVDLRGTNIGILWRPYRSDVRSDARFKEILRDLGLVDYFRTSGKWGDFCRPLSADEFECH
jgi:TolB-like protein